MFALENARSEVVMHKVSVLAMDGFVPFDLSVPCEVFGRASGAAGVASYSVRVCSEATEVRSRNFTLQTEWGLEELASADTVLVPGVEDPTAPVSPAVLGALQSAWERGARLASICSGAFVLAATGLLDGRRATTHWICADEFARRYPRIQVDPNVLFVDEGRLITSAGASAGVDMCLHLLRRDYGQAVAADAARLAVAPLVRDGGQSQFIRHEPPKSAASLASLLDWMSANLDRTLTVRSLADRARMSPRTLARRFQEQTGTTPLQWLLKMRIRRAQELLETSVASVDQIASSVGFESAVTFRSRFRKVAGISPTAYRHRFGAREH
ncbi:MULTISPECIES: GlxA family transcriptional regulator [Bradyrhizobium]|uniref:GlxA family transcriptional regulator n=1 Tax=Bradyrhizobium elkanii TaxID=29448 RepID=UPI001FDA98D8|nr:helix-turn-helix domain-containing protein [Bradyrhizobium elkanii]